MLLPDTGAGAGRRRGGPSRPAPRLIPALLAALVLVVLAGCGASLDDSLTELEVGDCIESPGFDVAEVDSVDEVECGPGALEVVERFQLEGDGYPGDDAIQEMIGEGCPIETIYTLGPTQDSWEKVDDRLVVCFMRID